LISYSFEEELRRRFLEMRDLKKANLLAEQRVLALEDVVSRLEDAVRNLGGELEFNLVKRELETPINNEIFHICCWEPFLRGWVETKHEIVGHLSVGDESSIK